MATILYSLKSKQGKDPSACSSREYRWIISPVVVDASAAFSAFYQPHYGKSEGEVF